MKYSDIIKVIRHLQKKNKLFSTDILVAITVEQSLDWLDKETSEEEFNFLCRTTYGIYQNTDNISLSKISDVVCCAYYGEYYFEQTGKIIKLNKVSEKASRLIWDNLFD